MFIITYFSCQLYIYLDRRVILEKFSYDRNCQYSKASGILARFSYSFRGEMCSNDSGNVNKGSYFDISFVHCWELLASLRTQQNNDS